MSDLVGNLEDRYSHDTAQMCQKAQKCTSFQKFKVENWPKEDYGKFYNGDSYIILNVSCQWKCFKRTNYIKKQTHILLKSGNKVTMNVNTFIPTTRRKSLVQKNKTKLFKPELAKGRLW